MASGGPYQPRVTDSYSRLTAAGGAPSLLDQTNRATGTGTSGLQAAARAGLVFQIGGGLLSAVSSWYAADAAKTRLKAEGLSFDFEASIARQNARNAERDAQAILQAGERQAVQLGLEQGQDRGRRETAQAASGTEAGVGSAAEVEASARILEETDRLTIDSNAIRAAGAQRMQGVNFQNQALLADVSARNARRSAKAIKPWAAAATSLLASSASVAPSWYSYASRY